MFGGGGGKITTFIGFCYFIVIIFYCSCSCLLHLYERFTEGALGAQREASNQTRGVREYFSEKVELQLWLTSSRVQAQ